MNASRIQRTAALLYGLAAIAGAVAISLVPRGVRGDLFLPFEAALHQGFLPFQLVIIGVIGIGCWSRVFGRSWYGPLAAASLLGTAQVGFRVWLGPDLPLMAAVSGTLSLLFGVVLTWGWLRGDIHRSKRWSFRLSILTGLYFYFAVGYYPFGILVNHLRRPDIQLSDLTPAEPVERHVQQVGEAELSVFYGELHGHTLLSVDARQSGSTGPEEYYPYARDIAGLDFAALTEHDSPNGISDNPDLWRYVCELADEHHEPGRFVTFKAFEWTSGEGHHEALRDMLGLDKARFHDDDSVWGHRNVFFPTAEVPEYLISHRDAHADEPRELWEYVRKYDALAIPHHPLGGPVPAFKWEAYDADVEGIVELYSAHGNSEKLGARYQLYNPYTEEEVGTKHGVLDALDMGHTFGVIGATDTHMGWGGNGTTRPDAAKPEQLVDFLQERYPDGGGDAGGGLAGVYAEELTRASLWEAFLARRTFATTGPRMVAWLEAEGTFMGGIGESAGTVDLRLGAVSTADIEVIELVSDGGNVVHEVHPEPGVRELELAFTDPDAVLDTRWYLLRVVQTDGEMAWTSPVRLNGSRGPIQEVPTAPTEEPQGQP